MNIPRIGNNTVNVKNKWFFNSSHVWDKKNKKYTLHFR